MSSKSIFIKDLITIGIFNAIARVIYFIASIVFVGVPFLYISLSPIIIALLNGPVFILLLLKTESKNIFFISGVIQGTIFSLIMGLYGTLILGPLFGYIADRVAGNKSGTIRIIFAYSIFITGLYLGQLLLFIIFTDWFLSLYSGSELHHNTTLSNIFTSIVIIFTSLSVFISGIIGGFIGTRMLKKHFIKAGIV